MFGYRREEAIGQHLERILHPPTDKDDGARQHHEVVRWHRSGRPLSLSVVTGPLTTPDGQLAGFAATARDLTEFHRRAHALEERNAQLARRDSPMRALAARLNAVREEERTRIAREVHDVLGQLLTGLHMDLGWIDRRIGGWGEAARLGIPARIAEAEELVQQIIGTVQRIAIELRPSTLDALGLAAAMRDEARRFEERSGVPAEIWADDAIRPDPQQATALFRIFQELLTNVARHARASRVRAMLTSEPGGWRLEVADNGVGFDPVAQDSQSSLGLLGMYERAELLGGTVRIDSAPGRGTTVSVATPRPGQEDRP